MTKFNCFYLKILFGGKKSELYDRTHKVNLTETNQGELSMLFENNLI